MRSLVTTDRAPRRRQTSAWTRAILAAATSLGVLACGPTHKHADDVGVALSFDPAPQVGDTTCHIRLTDAGGSPLCGATLEIEGNMNHAGMVPVFGTASESADGTYEAPLEFTMGGDWFVIVRGELADGRSLEEIVDVRGVPSAGGSGGAAPSCCSEAEPR